jgi:hypothetical protein
MFGGRPDTTRDRFDGVSVRAAGRVVDVRPRDPVTVTTGRCLPDRRGSCLPGRDGHDPRCPVMTFTRSMTSVSPASGRENDARDADVAMSPRAAGSPLAMAMLMSGAGDGVRPVTAEVGHGSGVRPAAYRPGMTPAVSGQVAAGRAA